MSPTYPPEAPQPGPQVPQPGPEAAEPSPNAPADEEQDFTATLRVLPGGGDQVLALPIDSEEGPRWGGLVIDSEGYVRFVRKEEQQ